jgi:hypothetical protein
VTAVVKIRVASSVDEAELIIEESCGVYTIRFADGSQAPINATESVEFDSLKITVEAP